MDTNLIYRGDCYGVLKRFFPDRAVDLIYLDPPFSFDPKYARLWYDKETLDMFKEMRKGGIKHFVAWMSRRLEQCHRVLKKTGSIYLHCDWKFGHYLKVEMDNIFGGDNFQNEIIWHYRRWTAPARRFQRLHDTIFFYTRTKESTFNQLLTSYTRGSVERKKQGVLHRFKKGEEPVLVSDREVQKEGVPENDVWQIPFIAPSSKERLGYPTQKPQALLERIIKASSNPNDVVLDPMCGCGTTIAVAHRLDRRWIGIDISPKACEIMRERMGGLEEITEVEVRGLPLTIKDLKELDAFEFEDYICDMTNSVRTRHVADKGIDGYYLGETPLQIKQQERVGRNTVDNFETALRRRRKGKGHIIAFSFTRNAYEEVARAKDDELDIRLIAVNELIKYDYDLEVLLELSC